MRFASSKQASVEGEAEETALPCVEFVLGRGEIQNLSRNPLNGPLNQALGQLRIQAHRLLDCRNKIRMTLKRLLQGDNNQMAIGRRVERRLGRRIQWARIAGSENFRAGGVCHLRGVADANVAEKCL